MRWDRSNRADPRARPLADRHYNRQKPGTPQFVPPGRCVVLLSRGADAMWVSSWPFAEYVRHEWAGAWVCSCFRNESPYLASELNREAVAATRAAWGDPPAVPATLSLGDGGPVPGGGDEIEVGFVTFLDRRHVRPTMVRGEPVYGWTWLKAGWVPIGRTKGGLLAFGLPIDRFPEPDHADEYLPLLAGLAVR